MNKVIVYALLLLIVFANIEIVFADDANLIPPEILKKMDPDIRSGKRPTFATIKQGDIFGLRQNPKFKADFVRFSFDVSKLSTVQQQIVEKWIRAGHNIVYLEDADIKNYAPLLKPVELAYGKQTGYDRKKDHPIEVKSSLLRHPVNTDCDLVYLRPCVITSYNRTNGRKYSGYSTPVFSGITENWSVIAEAKGGDAVAGLYPLEEGRVVFKNTVYGTDARRWELNFWHWAMGLGVPGAAETSIAGAGAAESGVTLNKTKQYDAIVLKNGDTITGTVQNKTFTVKTSYGTIPFETAKISKIVFEGSGSNVDAVRLKVGDKLSGVVQDEEIKVKLVSGTSLGLIKDKVKEINIRK